MPKSYVKSRSRYRILQTASAIHLPFPIDPQMRLAQLSESVPSFGVLKPFRPESVLHLQGFRPNMLVGTAPELQDLAEQVDLGTVDLKSLDRAVIVLTRCGGVPLTDVARVVLWQVFGVPLFEVFTGLDDAILGYECELHEGWHLAPQVAFTEANDELMLDAPGVTGLHTGLRGFVTPDKCPCGRLGPRLLKMEAVPPRVAVQSHSALA